MRGLAPLLIAPDPTVSPVQEALMSTFFVSSATTTVTGFATDGVGSAVAAVSAA